MISVLDWVVLLIYAGVVIALMAVRCHDSVMISPLLPEKTLDSSINNDTMCLWVK